MVLWETAGREKPAFSDGEIIRHEEGGLDLVFVGSQVTVILITLLLTHRMKGLDQQINGWVFLAVFLSLRTLGDEKCWSFCLLRILNTLVVVYSLAC